MLSSQLIWKDKEEGKEQVIGHSERSGWKMIAYKGEGRKRRHNI